MMEMNIIKADSEKREFVSVCYRANARGADQQGDEISVGELADAVTRFSVKPEIRIEHNDKPLPVGVVTVLSSYMTAEPHDGLPGKAWILHAKVSRSDLGDQVWARIKAGKRGLRTVRINGVEYPTLSGLSFGGTAARVPVA